MFWSGLAGGKKQHNNRIDRVSIHATPGLYETLALRPLQLRLPLEARTRRE